MESKSPNWIHSLQKKKNQNEYFEKNIMRGIKRVKSLLQIEVEVASLSLNRCGNQVPIGLLFEADGRIISALVDHQHS